MFLHFRLSTFKKLRLTSLLAFGGIFFFANVAQAWTIYPLRIARDLQPGKSITEVVTIDNSGSSETTRIDINQIDWVLNEKGEIDFPDAGTSKNSITKYISFHPAQLTLGPGERRSMRVTVSLPEDIGEGEHIGALSAREKVIPRPAPPQSQRVSVSLAVQKIYVMPIIVTVKGGKVVAGSIEELRVERPAKDQPYQAVVKIRNSGIVRITPVVTFILKDESGKEVFTSTPANYLITREFARDVSMALPKDLVGKFTLAVSVDQGKDFSLLTAQKSIELSVPEEKVKKNETAPAVKSSLPTSFKEPALSSENVIGASKIVDKPRVESKAQTKGKVAPALKQRTLNPISPMSSVKRP